MPIFLDTHAWVWWVTKDRRLSRKAARVIQEAVRGAGVSLSMISIWEIAKKVEKRQLVLDRPAREWIDQALSSVQPEAPLGALELCRWRLFGRSQGRQCAALAAQAEAVLSLNDTGEQRLISELSLIAVA